MPLTVCLASIFENNRDEIIDIYLFYNRLTQEDLNTITTFVRSWKQNIHVFKIDDDYFADAPAFRWTKEAYFRLLMGDLLASSVDRVLYLDVDIIVNKPLTDLYNLDLGDCYIAALREKELEQSTRIRLGLESGKYFQSGVLLCDLKKCRPLLQYANVQDVIGQLKLKGEFTVDQDVINVIFDGKIKEIDPKFNNCEITKFGGNKLNRLLNRVDKKELENTHVFHYSLSKPWNKTFSGSCEFLWYKYLLLSPFKDLYKERFGTLKYRILRSGIGKMVFFKYIDLTPYINNVAKKILKEENYIRLKNFYRQNIK